ncbi:MAG: hypothetical protein B7Z08_12550 [Sphingomonadales bacterium 32-68-7]|nr:MAG: hypothetical protein B7Z33_12925 [Sphingomonadales bacterium 12-68-11]OYX07346.1 MAG: hypothetical protein B7Z08_12550 [Sphingomonadales bacterium 32-68-7]
MSRSVFGFVKVSVATLAIALAASPAQTQPAQPPIARYTIDAGTSSGMMAMGGGGGIGAAMAMMRGGGNQVAHELILRLGSTRAATGEPKADHFLPTGARMGASLPLVTPPRGRAGPVPDGPTERTPDQQLPQGRLLLFWGCGERAGPGQPVVIDFSRLARGQVPPGLYAQNLNLPDDWSLSGSNNITFGEWPNGRNPRPVPADASLLGAHRIASTYAPEISFTLADDFMPGLNPVGRDLPSGAVALSWTGAPKATGYYAWAIGSSAEGNSRDMVWWTSSSTQQFGGPMSDWISPAAAARLVAAGTLLAPSRTTCTVPAEVREAGGQVLMTQLFGYGPQADFAYPPRPADARTPWRPEWTARVRFRSNAMVMLGMPGMGGMSDADEPEAAEAGAPAPASAAKPRCRGLRGIAERAAGLCE